MIKNISDTKMTATNGSTIEMNDITIAVPVSIKETTGLPIPPVVTVDVNLVTPELPDMIAAVIWCKYLEPYLESYLPAMIPDMVPDKDAPYIWRC